MRDENIESGSPKDWLRFAKSDLALSKLKEYEGVMLSSLCFHAQQTVEKSLKAILIQFDIPILKTHNIKKLVEMIPEILNIPDFVTDAIDLSDFAIISRYPGEYIEVSEEEYLVSIQLAEQVYNWTKEIIERRKSHE